MQVADSRMTCGMMKTEVGVFEPGESGCEGTRVGRKTPTRRRASRMQIVGGIQSVLVHELAEAAAFLARDACGFAEIAFTQLEKVDEIGALECRDGSRLRLLETFADRARGRLRIVGW